MKSVCLPLMVHIFFASVSSITVVRALHHCVIYYLIENCNLIWQCPPIGDITSVMDGIALPLPMLQKAGRSTSDAVGSLLLRLSGQPSVVAESKAINPGSQSGTILRPGGGVSSAPSSRSWIRRLLNADREALLADERTALGTILTFLEVCMFSVTFLFALMEVMMEGNEGAYALHSIVSQWQK